MFPCAFSENQAFKHVSNMFRRTKNVAKFFPKCNKFFIAMSKHYCKNVTNTLLTFCWVSLLVDGNEGMPIIDKGICSASLFICIDFLHVPEYGCHDKPK